MTCNEARRLITAYVKKELPDRELEQFLYHVEHCSDCMDELDTYYTVYQALDLLDSGGCHNYDFRNMLKNEIRVTKRGIIRRKIAGILLGVLMLAAELLLGVSVYTGYEGERGAQQSSLIERAILHMNYRGQKVMETEKVSEAEQETLGKTAQEAREKEAPQKQMAAGRMEIEEEQITNGRKDSTD